MKRKILLIAILSIFVLGICINGVTASHTFKVGKYKAKVTDKQYNYLKKTEKQNKNGYVIAKTGKYYNYKKAVYKRKKVTTTKWKYKNVLDSEDIDKIENDDYTVKNYNGYTKYSNKGWTWYGSFTKTYKYNWGKRTKHYDKFKKKVKVTKIKKVKVGYKKAKDPIYITISGNNGKGQNGKGVLIEAWSSQWSSDHDDLYIIYKYRKKL